MELLPKRRFKCRSKQ